MTYDPFQSLRSQFAPIVVDIIRKHVYDSFGDDSPIPPKIIYHMQTGGKRLRAIIPLRIAQHAGVEPQLLLPFAAACELLHNATLVHDDLQDGDLFRRGLPTVWNHYGAPAAVNVGDAMLFASLSLISTLQQSNFPNFNHTTQVTLINLFLSFTLAVIDGQEREFQLQDLSSPSWEQYHTVVKGKTSALFGLPIVGAATLLSLPQDLLTQLRHASQHLGVLFQIQDDLLDIYGDKGRSQSYSDIREGKISALMIHVITQLADRNDTERLTWLRNMLSTPRDAVTDQDVQTTLTLFDEFDTKNYILGLIEAESAAAVDAVTDDTWKGFVKETADLFCEPIREI